MMVIRLCWKNKIIIPFVLFCITVAMVIAMNFHAVNKDTPQTVQDGSHLVKHVRQQGESKVKAAKDHIGANTKQKNEDDELFADVKPKSEDKDYNNAGDDNNDQDDKEENEKNGEANEENYIDPYEVKAIFKLGKTGKDAYEHQLELPKVKDTDTETKRLASDSPEKENVGESHTATHHEVATKDRNEQNEVSHSDRKGVIKNSAKPLHIEKEVKMVGNMSVANSWKDEERPSPLLNNFSVHQTPTPVILKLARKDLVKSVVGHLQTSRPQPRKSVYMNSLFKSWHSDKKEFCEGKFTGYANEFALSSSVIINRKYAKGRKGGETIKEVLNQPEEVEFYQFEPGFMELKCSEKPSYYFNNVNHMTNWMMCMLIEESSDTNVKPAMNENFVLALTRYEYANIYHTMTDWYNAFLMMRFFNKTKAETNILLIDGHPQGALDPVWTVLFNSTQRLSQLEPKTRFKQLVWNMQGYNSPMMDHGAPSIPLTAEFRHFVLHSYGLGGNQKKDCDKLRILVIWRRDYLAHPRNPSGSITRKIENENEIIQTLRKKYPKFNIRGVQIDLFNMDAQLKFIASTDVLIGMHGAGLTHAMFLPSHAGLIELIPNYWSAANEHFMAIANWRNLVYERWINTDPHNEVPNSKTIVPPVIIRTLVKTVVRRMCPVKIVK